MKAQISCMILTASAISGAAYGFGSETIGPYTIVEAPVSASLLTGGGASFNWLNVVNAPVSINEAFSGFSVISDGYANANSGTVVLLTFASGALHNGPGADVVVFDAGNDGNNYRVAASHNNFASEALLTAANFIDTGVDRDYYYGGTGPTTFDVTAAEIDLSTLGVPNGATVDQLRLFFEGGSNDLLGVGVTPTAGPAIPAASTWGLLTSFLLLIIVGTLRSRRVVS